MVGLAGVDGGPEVGRAAARGARMTKVVEQAQEGRNGGGHPRGVARLTRIVYSMSTEMVKWVSMAAVGLDWRGVPWREG